MDQGTDERGNQTLGDKWKQKPNSSKYVGCSKSGSMSKVHSNAGLLKKQQQFQTNLILQLKKTEKEEHTKTNVRRKDIIKIGAEINIID